MHQHSCQPDDVIVCALNGVFGLAVAGFEFFDTQVGLDGEASGHKEGLHLNGI